MVLGKILKKYSTGSIDGFLLVNAEVFNALMEQLHKIFGISSIHIYPSQNPDYHASMRIGFKYYDDEIILCVMDPVNIFSKEFNRVKNMCLGDVDMTIYGGSIKYFCSQYEKFYSQPTKIMAVHYDNFVDLNFIEKYNIEYVYKCTNNEIPESKKCLQISCYLPSSNITSNNIKCEHVIVDDLLKHKLSALVLTAINQDIINKLEFCKVKFLYLFAKYNSQREYDLRPIIRNPNIRVLRNNIRTRYISTDELSKNTTLLIAPNLNGCQKIFKRNAKMFYKSRMKKIVSA